MVISTGQMHRNPTFGVKLKVEAIFGDSCKFEIDEYSEYIELHLKPINAVKQLESKHDDLRIVPFNNCTMTIRRDKK